MTAYAFGAGNLFGVRTDVTPSTPVQFGVIQDAEIDFDFSLKELLGQYQAPVAIGRGALKIQGKSKIAQVYSQAYNNLFFGQTQALGAINTAVAEAGTIPTTPFQVTVVNSATWQTDLGVRYAATGVPLVKVVSGPTTGQYSVAAGVYTFAAADTSLGVLISYTYTSASGAQKISLTNQLMGSAPVFQANFAETYQSKVFNLQLNACQSSKLTFPFKNQDFAIASFEWQSYADASGAIGYLTISE